MYLKTKKKLVKNSLLLLITLGLLVIWTTGCTLGGGKTGEDDNQQQPDLNLALFFVRFDQYDTYLVRETHTVPYQEDIAKAALEELIKDEKSIFPPGTKVLDIQIDDSLATVNFNDKVLGPVSVGAAGEELALQSIVNTLTELSNIEKVSFAVEGKSDGRAMDWWGHIGLHGQPFSRDLSTVKEPAIWVTHPTPNQTIGAPLFVKGNAMVYEGTVNIRVMDENGNLLVEEFTTAANAAPQRGEFEISIQFDPPSEGDGLVEAFWISPKDGSIMDKVSIPVQWP